MHIYMLQDGKRANNKISKKLNRPFGTAMIHDAYLVISATSFLVQILISGKSVGGERPRDAFVFTKSVTMKATKYVLIFGVIAKSS